MKIISRFFKFLKLHKELNIINEHIKLVEQFEDVNYYEELMEDRWNILEKLHIMKWGE